MASKIRIAARLRPFITGEVEDDAVTVHQKPDGTGCVMVVHPKDKAQHFKYPFSSCYGFDSTQDQIYDKDVKPLIDIVYNGVVVTVFAYGVTSSGKTHTVQGSRSDPGIIPRVIRDLFERKAAITQYEVNVSVSYMEVYKDEVYDLMVDRDTTPKLPIRERGDGQVFVANLSSHPLSTVKEFESVYSAASKRRSTGATNLNRSSSRSHAILTFTVDVINRADNQIMTGKINLVDLAGSENNKLTGNDASRMAESAAINRSLSVLGQVVHALNQGASRIPYRDSKLTRILQDALGGSAVGLLICNLAPGLKFRQDTLNSLNFATRTKEIENRPTVNVRDTQPMQKAHFAALAPPPPVLPAANIVADVPPQRNSGRPSLVPVPVAGPSRLPAPKNGRLSSAGFQTFSSLGAGAQAGPSSCAGLGLGLTQADLDERISKAVEAEVARRLAEKEKERAEQEEARRQAEEANASASVNASADGSAAIQSGVLDPILKRHQDLDDELNRRLRELEEKYERGAKDKDDKIEVMSPVSKKKLGRAYVALARSHSEKKNLQLALDFYKKAELYVPDNIKLKERIIEIDWAIKHGTQYVPEPKKKKKGKEKSSKASHKAKGDEDEDEPMKGPFGEATNTKAIITPQAQHKRGRSTNVLEGGDVEMMQTPAKRQRRRKGVGCADSDGDDDDDYEDDYEDQGKGPTRRTRARAQAQAEGA